MMQQLTDKQTVENQRFEINHFCERQEVVINKWIDASASKVGALILCYSFFMQHKT